MRVEIGQAKSETTQPDCGPGVGQECTGRHFRREGPQKLFS